MLFRSDLLTYNEARIKDDLEPVEGGDVPVSIYLKMQESKLTPQQPPQMPGMPTGDANKPAGGPLSGGVPKPENRPAEGTGLPVVNKAEPCGMNGLAGSQGGFYPTRKLARRRARRIVRKALESIED